MYMSCVFVLSYDELLTQDLISFGCELCSVVVSAHCVDFLDHYGEDLFVCQCYFHFEVLMIHYGITYSLPYSTSFDRYLVSVQRCQIQVINLRNPA